MEGLNPGFSKPFKQFAAKWATTHTESKYRESCESEKGSDLFLYSSMLLHLDTILKGKLAGK